MALAILLTKAFETEIRARGREYFQSGAVQITRGSEWEVEARVKGTAIYRVRLLREASEIQARCTCPYFQDEGACKHLWAAILASDAQNYLNASRLSGNVTLQLDHADERADNWFADLDDEDELISSDEPDAWQVPGRSFNGHGESVAEEEGKRNDASEEDQPHWVPLTPEVNQQMMRSAGAAAPLDARSPVNKRKPNWLKQLAALGRGARELSQDWPEAETSERELIYVLDVAATLAGGESLVVEVLAREPRADGSWGKPKQFTLSRWEIQHLPDPNDQKILAMIGGAQAIQTNHVGVGGNGGTSQSTVNVGETSTVRYQHRLQSPLTELVMPLIAQTGRLYLRIAATEDELLPLAWDDGSPWQFFIEVQRTDERYEVSGKLRRELNGEALAMPLSEPLLLQAGGLLCTRTHVARFDDNRAFNWIILLRHDGKVIVPRNDIQDFLVRLLSAPSTPYLALPAELQFTEVAPVPCPHLRIKSHQEQGWGMRQDHLRGALWFEYDDQLIRHQSAQRGIYHPAARQFLRRTPAIEMQAVEVLRQTGWKGLPPSYRDDTYEWQLASGKLPKVVRQLLALGWHVEAEGKVFRRPGKFDLQVSSGIDWFELYGAFEYEGQLLKLPALLAAVQRGEAMVKLGDGTYGMLPEEWLEKYSALLGVGQAADEHVRFKQTQIGLLDALLAAQPEIAYDEKFAHARARLQRFAGIAEASQPPGFIGELRGYQKEGLGWMHFLREFGFGGCLADDMGVGKTAQVLALLETRRALRREEAETAAAHAAPKPSAPSLVVVPKSLVFNWKLEAQRFTPKLRVLAHTGQLRQKTFENFADYDVILTTYGTLRNDAVAFREINFDYIILDEAQAIKNADTGAAKAVRLLRGDHKLALSGTPIENHLGELWSLFEFLNPGMLGQASLFNLTGAGARNPAEETRRLLAQALRPFILRRTKQQVVQELPPKQEQTLFCELEPQQRKLYDELRLHYRQALLNRIDSEGLKKSKILVLEALLRLRQAACHPGLIDKSRVHESSAKLDLLLAQLESVTAEGHKALIFSQFTSLLAILKPKLDALGLQYEYLDGKTRDRQAHVENFQRDPACKLFLISLKAGGVGLNLTAAEYVFLLDPWWNPAVEAQAIDRAHRIGQDNHVFAYRLIARDTVEEKVLALQHTKRDLAEAIINVDNSLIGTLNRDDLELLLS